jgi:hypothetical protein
MRIQLVKVTATIKANGGVQRRRLTREYKKLADGGFKRVIRPLGQASSLAVAREQKSAGYM